LALLWIATLAVDLLVFGALWAARAGVQLSQSGGFWCGAILLGVFLTRQHPSDSAPARQFGRLFLIASFGFLLRAVILVLLIDKRGWDPLTAALFAIPITTAVFFAGAVSFVSTDVRATLLTSNWQTFVAALVAYALLIKLIFMGTIDLIPEEAYYWNYAQHPAWGYLDHPPMVAWLIGLSTAILGKSEFALRLPAFLCWFIAAYFMFRLTANICDRAAAFAALLLLAVLPIYFGLGFFITPDAPLFAAWTGCLYFLERALLANRRGAWWGVGLCLGIGMLSKYTAALLGLGAIFFIIVDRQSRRWFFRPEPYLAVLASLVLFSPVLFWNMQNKWTSIVFQSANRWGGDHQFSLHVLIGFVLLVITPMGMLGVIYALLPARGDATDPADANKARQHLWAVIFTLAPLSIFVIHSILDRPKFNWTAPVWLAAIPLVAHLVVAETTHARFWSGRRFWTVTSIGLVLLISASFYYITLGLPGAGPMSGERLFGDWRIMGREVAMIRRAIELKTGAEPIIVGMDKNFISSELSFYDEGAKFIGGSHLFGSNSLMWAVWFADTEAVGKNILMVDLNPKKLRNPSLAQYFERLDEMFRGTIKRRDGRIAGYYYWRIGYGYRGNRNNGGADGSP